MVRIEALLRAEEAAVVLQALDVARRRAWQAGDARGARAADPSAPARRGDAGGVSAEGASCAAPRGRAEISAETSPPARRADEGQRHESPHEPRPALSRADALVAVAESWLSSVAASGDAHDTAGLPVELVVHVDHAALAGAGSADRHGRSIDPDRTVRPDSISDAPRPKPCPRRTPRSPTARRSRSRPPGASPATRASCSSTTRAQPRTTRTFRRATRVASLPGCAARFACATTAAAFPAARTASRTRITSSPGSTAALRGSRTCSRSAVAITASCTSTAPRGHRARR